ncbi:MAG TPA: hypothetical protein VKG25_08095, partial [Bryobacteraceae bacterium]|nr:hypothetical protein [Bryobacteraceae bacterium]
MRAITFSFIMVVSTMLNAAPGNPYSELDKEAQNAVDTSSATLLFEDIYSRTLGGALPPSLMQRMVGAHLAFLQQKHAPVQLADVASAVNRIGTGVDVALGTQRFTGTNATQVRLLRASFYGELTHLLAFPTGLSNRPEQAELSPAGAVYMTFLLLRQ